MVRTFLPAETSAACVDAFSASAACVDVFSASAVCVDVFRAAMLSVTASSGPENRVRLRQESRAAAERIIVRLLMLIQCVIPDIYGI